MWSEKSEDSRYPHHLVSPDVQEYVLGLTVPVDYPLLPDMSPTVQEYVLRLAVPVDYPLLPDMSPTVQEYVLGLAVPVDYPLLVQMTQSQQNLGSIKPKRRIIIS